VPHHELNQKFDFRLQIFKNQVVKEAGGKKILTRFRVHLLNANRPGMFPAGIVGYLKRICFLVPMMVVI
jgi:hypothetical protein